MIDTHCHLTFPEFEGRESAVLDAAAAAGVTGVITVSTTAPDAERCLALARRDPRIWSSAGVHPLYSDKGPHDWALLRSIIRDPRCAAWGELGLDNHYPDPPKPLQRAVLDEHLSAIAASRAEGVDKPVIIHCREAYAELIPILRASGIPADRFVFHCFTGTAPEARSVLDFGALISFTGVVTYKNAAEVRAAAALVPAGRIMVETDAPFLSPEPHRSLRPNEPRFARVTAEAIAALRGESFDAFHAHINATTTRFFGIPA